MATTYTDQIQQLYVAYFNRPADPGGLAHYETVLEAANGDATAVAAAMASISAEFAASTEYKANFTGMTNDQIVNTVYMNLFGRAADASGLKFYSDALTSGALTVDAVVTEVAKGAQLSDKTAFDNKVTAAEAFTKALTATDSYDTQDAATAAKAFLSAVTDDASLASSIDPVALQNSIAKVDAAAHPFTLETGLAALSAANAAKAAFLTGVDSTHDAATVETNINAAVTTKAAAVAAIINTVDTDIANAGTVYTTTTTSDAIKAALVTEAQSNLAADLTADQKAVTADNTAISKVAGLSDVINAFNASATAVDNAQTTDTAAQAAAAGQVVTYNTLHAHDAGFVAVSAGADYTVANLITTDSHGNLVLATGVTEATNTGVTALLNSLIAEKSADMSLATAMAAEANAQITLDVADQSTAGTTALQTLASHMTQVTLAANTLPTAAQIITEQSDLLAIKTAADAKVAAEGSSPVAADVTAQTNAQNAYDSFNTDIANFHSANAGGVTLSGNLAADTAAVTADQKAIDGLTKALSDLATATSTQTQLNAVNDRIDAATTAFSDNKLATPVTLDATHASVLATANADVYVAATTNATISGFGLVGSDALYVGSKYVLNTDLTKGNDSVLEAFVTSDGHGNTLVSLEQKAFASSESTPGSDMVTITLTGVDSTHVHLSNGIITVS